MLIFFLLHGDCQRAGLGADLIIAAVFVIRDVLSKLAMA